MTYYVYMVSNDHGNVLYIGVTNNLLARVNKHKEGEGSKFTTKYKCTKLVYFETFQEISQALGREGQLKNWKREWKEQLIDTINLDRKDLAEDLVNMI